MNFDLKKYTVRGDGKYIRLRVRDTTSGTIAPEDIRDFLEQHVESYPEALAYSIITHNPTKRGEYVILYKSLAEALTKDFPTQAQYMYIEPHTVLLSKYGPEDKVRFAKGQVGYFDW
jgi:hypothetical protein